MQDLVDYDGDACRSSWLLVGEAFARLVRHSKKLAKEWCGDSGTKVRNEVRQYEQDSGRTLAQFAGNFQDAVTAQKVLALLADETGVLQKDDLKGQVGALEQQLTSLRKAEGSGSFDADIFLQGFCALAPLPNKTGADPVNPAVPNLPGSRPGGGGDPATPTREEGSSSCVVVLIVVVLLILGLAVAFFVFFFCCRKDSVEEDEESGTDGSGQGDPLMGGSITVGGARTHPLYGGPAYYGRAPPGVLQQPYYCVPQSYPHAHRGGPVYYAAAGGALPYAPSYGPAMVAPPTAAAVVQEPVSPEKQVSVSAGEEGPNECEGPPRHDPRRDTVGEPEDEKDLTPSQESNEVEDSRSEGEEQAGQE